MAMSVGFIGVGNMGNPMAGNVLKTPFPMMVFDVNPKAMENLVKAGARAAGSAREVVEQSEIVTDHDERPAVPPEEPHQPVLGVAVEVVRGLVQEQEVGAREQDPGELESPPFATGERSDRQVEPVVGQA